jgi:hypothetical protein
MYFVQNQTRFGEVPIKKLRIPEPPLNRREIAV